MNKPNSQQCLAKTGIAGVEITNFFYMSFGQVLKKITCPKSFQQTDGRVEHRQCPILRLARFTKPVPDNELYKSTWTEAEG